MSILWYDGIPLKLLRTNTIHREDVYSSDGTDYLWTKWVIDVVGLYNNGYNHFGIQLNSDQAASDGQGFTPAATFATPTLTDHALRHRLSQPRRLLRFTVANPLDGSPFWVEQGDATAFDEVVVEAPGKDQSGLRYACDPAGGPFPAVHDIVALSGGVAFQVRYTVVCHTNDCQLNPASAGGGRAELARREILSNRFTMTTGWNEDQLTTITVRGEADFRKDRLTNYPFPDGGGTISADQYRSQLFLPIRQHFQRIGASITLKSDNSGVVYEYTDVERPISFSNRRNAVRVEAVHRQVLRNRADIQQAGFSTVSRLLADLSSAYWARTSKKEAEKDDGGVGEAVGDAALAAGGGPVGAMAVGAKRFMGAAAGWALKYAPYVSMAGALLDFAENVLPSFTENITVSVQGNRKARKKDLYFLALAIASGKVNPPIFGQPVYEFDVMYDLFNQFVRVSITYQYSFTLFGFTGVTAGMKNMIVGPSDTVYGGSDPYAPLVMGIINPVSSGLVSNVLPELSRRFEQWAQKNDPDIEKRPQQLRPTYQFQQLQQELNARYANSYAGLAGALPETFMLIGSPFAVAPQGTSLNPLPWGDGRSVATDFYPAVAMPDANPCTPPPNLWAVGNPFYQNTNPFNQTQSEFVFDYYRYTNEPGTNLLTTAVLNLYYERAEQARTDDLKLRRFHKLWFDMPDKDPKWPY